MDRSNKYENGTNHVLCRRLSFNALSSSTGKKRRRSNFAEGVLASAISFKLSNEKSFNSDEKLKCLKEIAFKVVSTFRKTDQIKAKEEDIINTEYSASELVAVAKSAEDRDFILCLLQVFTYLGYVAKLSYPEGIFYSLSKKYYQINPFWNTSIESLFEYMTQLLESNKLEDKSLLISFSDFIISESEEIYFSSLSRILRSGGHKLKSKLKPENIGLLIPGEFLPAHQRELKNHVALQISEKSNHLYTWKIAGEKNFAQRKRTSWSSLMSRNIRPKNRVSFPGEKAFYSGWDTTFYTVKCEEVLENEYYNQLENNLNNHTKKRQISMKKVEINKKKKSNDTKDSFYYTSFLERPFNPDVAYDRIENLRKKALQMWLKKNPSKTVSKGRQQEISTSNRRNKETNSTTNSRSKSPSKPSNNKNAKTTGDDDEQPPNLKKESRIGGCAKKIKVEVKTDMDNDCAYKNNVLGTIIKPKSILDTKADLLQFVQSKPVGIKKIKDQFNDQVIVKVKARQRHQRLKSFSKPDPIKPNIEKMTFNYNKELESYRNDKFVVQRTFSNPDDLKVTIRVLLEEMIYNVVYSISIEIETGSTSSGEDISNEFYKKLHDEYLNISLSVDLNDLSGNVVLSPNANKKKSQAFFKSLS